MENKYVDSELKVIFEIKRIKLFIANIHTYYFLFFLFFYFFHIPKYH